jgi:hypothetical protein
MRLIAKSEVLGTLEDDDDIEWKPDPFEIRPDSVKLDSPDELLDTICFEGSSEFQEKLRALCREYIDVFSTSVRRRPADVDPMEITVDRQKWKHPTHRLPPRRHSSEKQAMIRFQTEALLRLGANRRPPSGAKCTSCPNPTPMNGDSHWTSCG